MAEDMGVPPCVVRVFWWDMELGNAGSSWVVQPKTRRPRIRGFRFRGLREPLVLTRSGTSLPYRRRNTELLDGRQISLRVRGENALRPEDDDTGGPTTLDAPHATDPVRAHGHTVARALSNRDFRGAGQRGARICERHGFDHFTGTSFCTLHTLPPSGAVTWIPRRALRARYWQVIAPHHTGATQLTGKSSKIRRSALSSGFAASIM